MPHLRGHRKDASQAPALSVVARHRDRASDDSALRSRDRCTSGSDVRSSRERSVSWQVPRMSDLAPDVSTTTGPSTDAANMRTTARAAPPELMTVTQAARWLGLSRSTLYEALARHRIAVTPIDIGGQMRLSRRQLERWLEGSPAVDEPAPEPPAPAVALPRGSSVYDEVSRDLAPAAGPRRSPTRSADARSSSASACA